jgi:hypothetical protein
MITCMLWLASQAQVSVKVTDVRCHGGNDGMITISSDFNLNYEWSDGVRDYGSSTTRTRLKAGVYTVIMRLGAIGEGGGDCFDARSIEVNEPDQPLRMHIKAIPDPGPHPCWRTAPLTFQVTASGGTPPYKINGKLTDLFELRATSSGEYYFRVTDDNNCIVKDMRIVIISTKWCSSDPNDIVGPSGYEDPQWVSKYDTLPYTIRFENDPLLATAPAQYVLITHDFDEEINPYSFRLSSFGFGDHTFTVPDNVPSFQKRYDLTEELDIYLDVVAGLNVAQNRAFWSLTAIDPLTGQRPVNPLVGFLPVNDTLTASGEGYVSFSMRPAANTVTGDTAHAQAVIIFDENESIQTNIWTNVIDALPPVTTLDALSPVEEDNLLSLSWNGSDDPNGSGLSHVLLYVSIDSGAFEQVDVIHPDSVLYTYSGQYGSSHQFKILGVDNTGNVEQKTDPDGSVFILPRKDVNLEELDKTVYCTWDTIDISWTTVLVDSVDLFMKIVIEDSLIELTQRRAADQSPFEWIVPDSLASMQVQLFVMMADSSAIRDSSIAFYVSGLPEVNAGDDIETCEGAIHHLFVTGGETFLWDPISIYSSPDEPILSFIADTSIEYHVTGADIFGCINSDSVTVTVHPVSLDSVTYLMCNQDSLFVGGGYQTEPGFYIDELASTFGCDSTVVTEIVLTGPCTFPSPQVYVDKDATGLNNGTSWANAFVELKDALEAARDWANADEIWIAEGIYSPHPTRRDTSFILHDSISIYGGFLGVELNRAERTSDPELVQISGDINIADTLWDNSYHTLVLTDQCLGCIVDGVTITYGHADDTNNANDIGAGVLNQGVGHFYNVVFERNYATDHGAALHSSGAGANLIIEDCIFRLNTSSLGRDVVNLAGAQVEFRGANGIH